MYAYTSALLYGDPHVITLDGLPYTFNGAGEYLIMDALNKSFLIQARAEPVERSDGGPPVGTVFTAIAIRTNYSVVVEVQRSSLRGINIVVNGERLTINEPTEWQFEGVAISYEGNHTVVLLYDTGEHVEIKAVNNLLQIEMAAGNINFQNNTKGLLGNWNGDPDDDFLRPDGSVLSPNATLEEIHHQFGEKCEHK